MSSPFVDFLQKFTPDPLERWVQKDALPAVGRAIENPFAAGALSVLAAADTVVQEAFREPVTTGLVYAGEMGRELERTIRRGEPFKPINLRQAEALAETVNIGDALLTTYRYTPWMLTSKVMGGDQDFMQLDFNLFDPEQKAEAFDNDLMGEVLSNTIAFAVDPLMFVPFGKATSAGRVAMGLARTSQPVRRMAQYQAEAVRYVQEATQAAAVGATYKPTSGLGVWIDNILTETEPARLFANPLTDEWYLRELAAATRTPQEAALLALSRLGDVRAAETLTRVSPALGESAEMLNRVERIVPLTVDDVLTPTPLTADDVNRTRLLLDDLLERNPKLADQAELFTTRASAGGLGATATRVPTPNVFLEQRALARAKTRTLRLTGTPVEQMGGVFRPIREIIVGGGAFRPVRVLTFPARWRELRPLGYASLSNPRANELAEEVAGYLNMSPTIRAARTSRDSATRMETEQLYIRAQNTMGRAATETERRLAVEQIEQEAALFIYQQAFRKLFPDEPLPDSIPAGFRQLQGYRDNVVTQAVTDGVVGDLMDPVRTVINPLLKTKLADSVPMLDIRRVDSQIVTALRKGKQEGTGIVDTGYLARTMVETGFESFNTVWSASVLLRPGYIPKNAIFEPAFRTFLKTGGLGHLHLMTLGARNAAINSTYGFRRAMILLNPSNRRTEKLRQQTLEGLQEKQAILLDEITETNAARDKILSALEQAQRKLSEFDEEAAEQTIQKFISEERATVASIGKLSLKEDGLLAAVDELDVAIRDLDDSINRARLAGRSTRKRDTSLAAKERRRQTLLGKLTEVRQKLDKLGRKRERLQRKRQKWSQENLPDFLAITIADLDNRAAQFAEELARLSAGPQSELGRLGAEMSDLALGSARARAAALRVRRQTWKNEPTMRIMVNGRFEDSPNIWALPGGRADMSEANNLSRLYSLAGVPNRPMRQTDLVVAQPGSKAYWDEYARTLDRLRVNDPLFRAVIRGDTDEQMMSMLLDDMRLNGRESVLFRLTIADDVDQMGDNATLARLSLTPRELREFVDQGQAELYAQKFIDNARAQVQELVPDEVVASRLVTESLSPRELQQVWEARGYRPEMTPDQKTSVLLNVPGRTVRVLPVLPRKPVETVSTNLLTATIDGMNKLLMRGFDLITRPEAVMFREPYAYRVGQRVMGELVGNARRQGVDITADTFLRYAQIARRTAVKEVEETFYSVRRMNNWQYLSRYMMGFPNAMYNSWRFYANQAIDNPYTLVLLNNIREAPHRAGLVINEDGEPLTSEEANRSTGETYLVIPYYLAGKLGEGATAFQGKMNLRQLDFLTAGPTPSFLSQIALSAAVIARPQLETTLKGLLGERLYGILLFGGNPVIDPAGDPEGYVANFLKTLIPAGVGGEAGVAFLMSMFADDFENSKGVFASTVWNVHLARLHDYATNNPNDPSPPDLESFEAESVRIARDWQMKRWLMRMLQPLGVTWEPRSAIVKDYYYQRVEFYTSNPDKVPQGSDIDDLVLADLITMFGSDPDGYGLIGYLISGREAELRVDPTQEAYRRYLDNRELIDSVVSVNPEVSLQTVGIITETVVPGEFSPAVYNHYQILGQIAGTTVSSEIKTVTEREAERQVRIGWLAFQQIDARYDALLAGRRSKGITATSNRDLWLARSAEVNSLKDENPAWAREFGNIPSSFPSNLAMIGAAIEDDSFWSQNKGPDATKWNGIAEWYGMYMEVRRQYQQLPPNTPQRDALRDWWADQTMRLRAENTFFADFHSRYLIGDEVINVNEELARASQVRVVAPPAPQPAQSFDPSGGFFDGDQP